MNKQLIIILLIVATISSCSTPKDLVYVGTQNFGMKHAGLKSTVLSMDVELYNPNRDKMKLKKADLDVYVNGNKLGKVNIAGKLRVPREDTFALPVMLNVDLANALPNMLQLAFKSEVDVALKGNVKAGRHGIYINIPVNYTGKQDIRQGLKW